jgi:hypothetical protein
VSTINYVFPKLSPSRHALVRLRLVLVPNFLITDPDWKSSETAGTHKNLFFSKKGPRVLKFLHVDLIHTQNKNQEIGKLKLQYIVVDFSKRIAHFTSNNVIFLSNSQPSPKLGVEFTFPQKQEQQPQE